MLTRGWDQVFPLIRVLFRLDCKTRNRSGHCKVLQHTVNVGHNDHADYVVKALRANKPVFVEKPIAITEAQLAEIIDVAQTVEQASVMVG